MGGFIASTVSDRYKRLTERVMRNILATAEAEGDEQGFVRRSRVRYGLGDIPADMFDDIVEALGISSHVDPKTRGRYYLVDEIRQAAKKLQ